jgi:hypothetical protein
MLHLLDADVLIRADNRFYPRNRFPTFWTWLAHVGDGGAVKIPREQYEEIVRGKGELVDWLKSADVKAALLLGEEADPAVVYGSHAPGLRRSRRRRDRAGRA